MPKRKAPLTVAQVSKLGPGNHRVGGTAGLTLQVAKGGGQGRSWTLRYSDAAGKRREVGIGSAWEITLQQARDKALVLRQAMRLEGTDPIQQKEAKRLEAFASTTFEDAATSYIRSRDGSGGNLKHADQWTTTLDRYASPMLGKLPVASIMPTHVAEALRPIWIDKAETAKRVRQRIEAVIAFADVQAHRQRPNPARLKNNLDKLLPQVSREAKHHAALPWREAPGFMAKLRQAEGMGARALEFAILCAARSGEVREATWSEIEGDVWVIPAARMKAKREHRVPLSKAALSLLKHLPAEGDLLFPGMHGKPLSDMSLLAVLKRLKTEATVHGFRSTFRDWCGDNGEDRELAEMALAHDIGNAVEAAYARSDLLKRRAVLMQHWARYLTA